MCGIVGYTGGKQVVPILIDGLKHLEYRGYDSAGVSVNIDGMLRVIKASGRLVELEKKLRDRGEIKGTTGLGHTRWATHGKPSDENSHPHLSETGRIAVVHNGIIENYAKLKEMLIKRGRKFVSETDTEVATQLIDYYYEGDILQAVSRAMRELEGAYALGIICVDEPDRLIAVKNQAPLILAYGEGESFFASDVTAILSYTREVSYLEDGEIADVSPDGIAVYNKFLELVAKKRETVSWNIEAAEKGGYQHFMLKEIMEQPRSVMDTISPRINGLEIDFGDVSFDADYVRGLDRIYIVACGSSYHVGIVAKYNIEKLVRKPVEVALASEFRYCDPIVGEKTLVILISQSGETADTLAALREAKGRGARVLSIVNVVGSSIAKESHDVIYTWAGPEIAVATTKAYSTQLAVTYLIALHFARCCGTIEEGAYRDYIAALRRLPEQMEQILQNYEHIQYLASIYFNNDDIFFIGRNIDYALSLEGSLKLKEISYIHSDAYAAGELKHGTISLVEEGTLVIAVASYDKLLEKTVSNALEVRARGAEVLVVTTDKLKSEVENIADNIIAIPDALDLFLPSLAVIPLQLFSYYIALQRGCDIDKPKNLAKSVTVE